MFLALRELRMRLADLPEDHRTALLLVTVQGMSYEEAAEVMGCAVGTATRAVSTPSGP